MRMEKLLPPTWKRQTYLMGISQLLAKTGQRIAKYQLHSKHAPCVMGINLSYEGITSSMGKLKADKTSGLDSVAPKLLKFAGDSITPSLLSVFNISATCNTALATWKAANISALYKK